MYRYVAMCLKIDVAHPLSIFIKNKIKCPIVENLFNRLCSVASVLA